MRPTVSLCMIVKDEAEQIGACLGAALAVAQEVIVVDTGSTDDTVAVASKFGARVSAFDFRAPDFAAARNRSLELATGEWILVLDADERLTPEAPAVVATLCAGAGEVAYVVQRRNLRPGGLGGLVDHAVRLFRNRPGHRYRGRVHETVDAAILACGGHIRTSALTIDHLLPARDDRALEKSRFYMGILKDELAAAPDDVDRLGFLRAELHKQGLLEEAARTAERIAELAPDDASSHVHVGLYRLVHRHDARGAEQAFRQALALRPDDPRALEGLEALARTPAG
jgi:glycosyltransferase involved in cell wall biosynthesis